LILGETTHWDPNWLMTSEGYFRWRVRRSLDRVLDELEADPDRVFGLECTFFLRMYWERCPEQRDRIAARLADGRLRMLGSGVTTPDTLLPEADSVLRDLNRGQAWLRSIGCSQEPRTLYLPDDFGHSPALPELLGAAGVDRAAFSRIDGMFFPGVDYRPVRDYPRPGSTAELLWEQERSADFVWRGADGSELLCHWAAHTYFMGDMLAARGAIRWMGITFGLPSRGEAAVAKRLEGYARRLERLARTPYLYCPIGCDFNGPIPNLGALVRRYDDRRYERTGLWVAIAGLDDYLALVDGHRSSLPTLSPDPNPYWMGFYASRPSLKQTCRELARSLRLEEARRVSAGPGPAAAAPEVEAAWDVSVLSNHHDFVTGTSPDRVVRAEQAPALEESLVAVRSTLGDAATPGDEGEPPGSEALAELGLELVSFHDTGGLWRLGHEFRGGRFEPRGRLQGGRLDGEEVDLSARRLPDGRVAVRFAGRVPRRRTWCLAWKTGEDEPAALTLDVPGGVVDRPLRAGIEPTFWSASTFARAGGAEVRFASVGAVGWLDGALAWIVGRNAPKETAWGFLPVLAHPARGNEDAAQSHECVLYPPGVEASRGDPFAPDLAAAAGLTLEGAVVDVLSVRPGRRGGVIVTLGGSVDVEAPERLRLGLAGRSISAGWRCAARERALAGLRVHDGRAEVALDRSIVVVRLEL